MAQITIGIMDPPFESANTTTAYRIIESSIKKGHDVFAFAYEGATMLTFNGQKAHANAVKGTNVEQEDHPLPKEWTKALFDLAKDKGTKLSWVNCGLCVDERGAEPFIEGPVRGSPVDAWKGMEGSQGVLFITTK